MKSYPKLARVTAMNTTPGEYNSFPGACRCHNGDFFAVYRSGVTIHGLADGGFVKFQRSTDKGLTWTTPATLIAAEAGFDMRDMECQRLSTPDHILMVVNAVPATGHSSSNEIRIYKSTDDCVTFGVPSLVDYSAEISLSTSHAVCAGSPLELTQGANAGRVLLPIYIWESGTGTVEESPYVYYSDDVLTSAGGGTWQKLSRIADGPALGLRLAEPNLLELTDGTILALMRHAASGSSRITRKATSIDQGVTWSALSTAINQDGRPQMFKFQDKICVPGRQQTAGPNPLLFPFRLHFTDESTLGLDHWAGSWATTRVLNLQMQYNYGALLDDAEGENLYMVAAESPGSIHGWIYCYQITEQANGETVVLADTFDRPDSVAEAGEMDSGMGANFAKWLQAGTGSGDISNGKFTNSSAVAGQNADLYFVTGVPYPDITVKLVSTNSFVTMRFCYDIQAANGYRITLSPPSNKIELVRLTGGSPTVLVNYDECTAGTEYTIRVQVTPQTINFLVNGRLVDAKADKTYRGQQYTTVWFNLDNVDGNAATVDDFSLSTEMTGYALEDNTINARDIRNADFAFEEVNGVNSLVFYKRHTTQRLLPPKALTKPDGSPVADLTALLVGAFRQ